MYDSLHESLLGSSHIPLSAEVFKLIDNFILKEGGDAFLDPEAHERSGGTTGSFLSAVKTSLYRLFNLLFKRDRSSTNPRQLDVERTSLFSRRTQFEFDVRFRYMHALTLGAARVAVSDKKRFYGRQLVTDITGRAN